MRNTESPSTASAAFSTSSTQCLAEVPTPKQHTKSLGTQVQHIAYTVPALPGAIGGRNTEHSHSGLPAQLLLAFRSSGNCTPNPSWSSVAGTVPETSVEASIISGPVASSCTDAGPSSSHHTILNCSPRCPQRPSEPFLRQLWGRLRSSINGDIAMHEGPSSRHPPICPTPPPTQKQKQKQKHKAAHDQSRRLRLVSLGRPSQGEAFSDLHRSHTAPPAPAGRLRDWSLSGRSRRSQDRVEARYTVSEFKSHAPIDTADMTTTASVEQLPHGVLSVGRRNGLGRLSDGCLTSYSASGVSHAAQRLRGHDNAPPLGLGLMQRLLRMLTGNAWSKGQGQVRCDNRGSMLLGGLGKRTRNAPATAVTNSETWVVSCVVEHRRRGNFISRGCTPLAANAAAAASEESSSDDADEALQLLRQQRRDSKVIHCARLHLGPRPQDLISGDGDCGSRCTLRFHLPGGAAEFAASAATAGTSSDTARPVGGTVTGPLAPRASALLAAGVSVSSPALLHSQLSPNTADLPASGSVSPSQSPAAKAPSSAAVTTTETNSPTTSSAAAGAVVSSHPGGALPAWSHGNTLTPFLPSTPLLPKLLPPIGFFHLEARGVCPESSPSPAISSPPPPLQQQGGPRGLVSSPPMRRGCDREHDHGEPLAAPREAKEKGSREKLQQLLPTSIANLRFRLAPLRRSAGGAGNSLETPQPNPSSVQVSPSGVGIVGVPSSSSSPMGLQHDDEQSSLSEPVAVLASTRSMRRLAICVDSSVE
ncbi:hypothetical protein Vafri_11986 [Volvox africanus]|uniref:Uncharacterized protein n=1 Tax=Volvox africanus TaxID=51714 RepID=A0A8J4BDV3_9CHLO|nr:hypothetical protein Vafri_11986 [Volvox africanus]